MSGVAEHGTETGRHARPTCAEQRAPVRVVDAEESPVGVGETAAHLHGSSLASGGAAEEVRDQRADEDQRGHARRHAAARFVDLFQDQVVAALGGFPPARVKQGDERAGDEEGGRAAKRVPTAVVSPVPRW